VLEAANGVEAIEICEKHPGPVHLLVTDAVMPRMGGVELARHLQSQRPGIKALYVSGYTDESIFRNGLLEAGAAFLQKPFSREALLLKVSAMLERQREGPQVSNR
jgi:YesN/AraC family two-component response regulator